MENLELERFLNAQFTKDAFLNRKFKPENASCSEKCVSTNKNGANSNGLLKCNCGEYNAIFSWRWSRALSSPDMRISNDNRDILFHPFYSSGTALVKGEVTFKVNLHYYWEIKITSTMYGTDFMIGIGTPKVDYDRYKLKFCSLLGIDAESWGYSYRGTIHHNTLMRKYGTNFGLGSIIGVHLDMCSGTLEYYINKKSLGVAFTGLKSYELYPMISSTAALSGVRLMCSVVQEPTLQMICLKYISRHKKLYTKYETIPGLKRLCGEKYFWITPNFDEEESSKRLADLEESLMDPLPRGSCLKSNKKLKTDDSELYLNDDSLI